MERDCECRDLLVDLGSYFWSLSSGDEKTTQLDAEEYVFHRIDEGTSRDGTAQDAIHSSTSRGLAYASCSNEGIEMKQQGQMTIEMMLLIVVFLGGAMALSKTAKEQKWIAAMVEGPWKPLQGMIEDGAWSSRDSKNHNPGLYARKGSYEGNVVQ
jgi:hypothetical protein